MPSTRAEKTKRVDLEHIAIGTGSWIVTLDPHPGSRVRTGSAVKP